MIQEPIWKKGAHATNFPQLEEDLNVDVAIIGGGITGITTAQLLQSHEVEVVVIEAHRVGYGTTGHSTGNLYEVTEYTWNELHKKYDIATLQQVVASRRNAMNMILHNINKLAIDCNLEIVPMHQVENDKSIDIDREIEIATQLSLPVERLQQQSFPLPFHKGLLYSKQAHINPLSYVQQLSNNIAEAGCKIYENSHINEIEEDKTSRKIFLKTDKATITARTVIHATHTPLGLQLQYHPVLGPYREYGVAVKLRKEANLDGTFWGNYNEKKFSLRSYSIDNESYLICVGSMHKVGQTESNKAHIEELKTFVKNNFDVEEVSHQWGGQNYKPADLLPYIGKKENDSQQYIATGFSTDGLVYGTLSAMIVADEITNVNNPFAELYKATRHKPVKAASKFFKENINMAGQMIKDLIARGESFEDVDLAVDEGKIVQHKEDKVAVYKNKRGEISLLSPICTHMGCTVHWNNAEKSWDCPCHGSRFNTSGEVIEGPALKRLEGK